MQEHNILEKGYHNVKTMTLLSAQQYKTNIAEQTPTQAVVVLEKVD